MGQEGGGDFVLVVKGTQKTLSSHAKNLRPEDSSPEVMTHDLGHGRIEWRGLQVREVTPEPMDQCRVRHPVSVTVLGILSRAVQGDS